MPAMPTKFTNVTITGELRFAGGSTTAVAGAATLNSQSGSITSEPLTTAAGAAYTLTLTNSLIKPTSMILASISNGTNNQGTPTVGTITEGTGTATITIRNMHATQAFNGTIIISYLVQNPV